jgi:hypothetical protein
MRLSALFASLLFSSLSVLAADVSGAWQLTVDTPNGKFESTVDLKQDGEKLTGTLHNQFGDSTVTGTVKDNEVALVQKAEINGNSMVITYAGKVEAGAPATKMSGKFKFGEQGEGDFTAVRK